MVVTIKPRARQTYSARARAEAFKKAGTAGIPTGYGTIPIGISVTPAQAEAYQKQADENYKKTISIGGAQLITTTKTTDVSKFGMIPGTATATTATGEKSFFYGSQQLSGTYEPATKTLVETRTNIYDISQGKPKEIISFQGRVPQQTTLTEVQISPTYAQLIGTTRVEMQPSPSEMGGQALAQRAHNLFYPEEATTTQEYANISWQEKMANLGFYAKPKAEIKQELPQGIPISTYTATTQEELAPYIRYKREAQQFRAEGKYFEAIIPSLKSGYFYPTYKAQEFQQLAQQERARGEYGMGGVYGISSFLLAGSQEWIRTPEYTILLGATALSFGIAHPPPMVFKDILKYSSTTTPQQFLQDVAVAPAVAFQAIAFGYGEKLKTMPESTIGTTMGILTAPVAWTEFLGVAFNPLKRSGATYVEPERVFDIKVLAGEQTFPTAKSVPEALARFKVAKYIPEGETTGTDLLGAHVTAEPFLKKTIGEGAYPTKDVEKGLFITPSGEASPYFLKAGAMPEYPYSSISLNPLSMFKFPKVIQIAYGGIERYPPSILKQTMEASNIWLTEQAGTRNVFITRGFETGRTSEIEAIIPPTSEIRLIKDNMNWLQRIKGYKYYTEYKGAVVPIKTYELIGERGAGISEPSTSYLKVMKEVEGSYKKPQQNLYEYLGGVKGSPYYRGESYAGGYSYAPDYSYQTASYRASSMKESSYKIPSYQPPQYYYEPYSYRIPLPYQYPSTYRAPSQYYPPPPPPYYPPTYKIPPPYVPPTMIPFGYIATDMKKKAFVYKPRAFKYAPSLAGISLGIKIGKAPTGALSGIGIRGIPGMSNKKLKRFMF
jgi:hypothetical protein